MTQTFKVGQTVWWPDDNLQEVHEATITEVIFPSYWRTPSEEGTAKHTVRRRDMRWQIELSEGDFLIVGWHDIYGTKKGAYSAAFTRLNRAVEIAQKKFDDVISRRGKLFDAAIAGNYFTP